jgi:hypothetical protein
MQLTGIAQDQNGTEWYIVKNSWGDHQRPQRLPLHEQAYVQYKTTAFMVNKKGRAQRRDEEVGDVIRNVPAITWSIESVNDMA